jgi:hypothetical protein
MKDKDKARFQDNIIWFNHFFDGLRHIYEHIVELLPREFFHEGFVLNSGNFFFPRYKAAPSLPPYYALLLEGKTFALQMVSIVDANLFAQNGLFIKEPSMITLIHTQPEKYGWIDDFALSVIKNQNVELTTKERGVVHGKITGKFPANFFAFQIQYDKFTDDQNLLEAVRQNIVDPIIVNLGTGSLDTTI